MSRIVATEHKTIMAIINFGGTKEEVITRQEFPMARARKVLKPETIAILGYGVQGPAQGLLVHGFSRCILRNIIF